MAVAEINHLTIEKGTDFNESFKIYNEDGIVLGINTTYSGVSKLKKYPTSPIEYPFGVSFDVINEEVSISMASTITSTLPSGRCYFDLILTSGFSNPLTKKYVKGTIMVNESVS